MPISWVTSSGESGIAEDSYEFAMQHQGKGDYQEQTPQSRIDKAFDITEPKRLFDQNNPLTWGLGEINQSIDSMMQYPGPDQRQDNIQQELDSGQSRVPVERQAFTPEGYAAPPANSLSSLGRPSGRGAPDPRYSESLTHRDTSGNVDDRREIPVAVLDRLRNLLSQDPLLKPFTTKGSWEIFKNAWYGRINPEDLTKLRAPIATGLGEELGINDIPYVGMTPLNMRELERGSTPTDSTTPNRAQFTDEEVDANQSKLAEMLHDLRVKITGDPEKWATKEHIGDFVDKAMSVMGGGIRRPPGGPRGLGRGLSSSIGEERIQSAAMKVGDKVYEGENHGIAYEKAGDHNPAMAVEEGFTTNKGRFVSREEAAGIAKKQEQVLLEARQTENLHSGELKYGFERVPQSEQEPPLKKGFTRLYRAETSTLPGEKAAHVSEWIADSPEYQSMLQSTGRWFTNSKEAANYYMTNQGGKSISHVDVPTKDVEGYRASNNPEAKKYIASGRENEEFFLPSELASSRKPLVQPPKEPSKEQWSKYQELSSQGKTTKQIIKATKMDPEVVRDALGRDNLALAAFNSENALTEAYFNQLKTMPPDLEKALRAKGVSVKDLKTFTRSLPEEDLAHIFQQLPENVKTWWQAGELRRQKIDEGKKASMIPKGSKPLKE